MAKEIATSSQDFMPDTLVAQAGSTDAFGEWTASGSPVNLTCRMSGGAKLVRNAAGQEVVSNARAIVGSASLNLSARTHRFTLPAGFDPRIEVEAILIREVRDENGPHHTVIEFP